MNTVKLEIHPDGKTAKTLNPLGRLPKTPFDFEIPANARCSGWEYLKSKESNRYYDRTEYLKADSEWQQAEQQRKTYMIESVVCQGVEYTQNECEDGIILQPGTIHDAIIINETHCRIV